MPIFFHLLRSNLFIIGAALGYWRLSQKRYFAVLWSKIDAKSNFLVPSIFIDSVLWDSTNANTRGIVWYFCNFYTFLYPLTGTDIYSYLFFGFDGFLKDCDNLANLNDIPQEFSLATVLIKEVETAPKSKRTLALKFVKIFSNSLNILCKRSLYRIKMV